MRSIVRTIVQRKIGVSSEVVDGKLVLIAPSGKEIITLNEVGTFIWNAFDLHTDVDALTDYLLKEMIDVERDQLEQDLGEFLHELQENDLIDLVS